MQTCGSFLNTISTPFSSPSQQASYQDVVVMAEELRAAVKQLGSITGEVRIEEILDVVFADFCIGK